MYRELARLPCFWNQTECHLSADSVEALRIVPLVLLILGTVGNAVSFVVFMRRALRDVVTTLYYRALVVINLVTLWVGICLPIPLWWSGLNKEQSVAVFTTLDVVLPYLMYCEAWTLVTVCLERYVGVMHPHRALVSWTKKRAFYSLGAVAVFGFVLILPDVAVIFLYYDITEDHQHVQYLLPATMRLLFHVLIPVPVLVYCNIGINVGIIRSKRNLGLDTTTTVIYTSMSKILMSLMSLFIILSTPCTIVTFLAMHHSLSRNVRHIVIAVSLMIFYVNCCVKFIVFRSICPRFSQQCNILCGLEKAPERISVSSSCHATPRHNMCTYVK